MKPARRPNTLGRLLARRLLLVSIGVVGCNAILDNRPGELRASASGQSPAPGDDGCAPREHACGGICVPDDDPRYGCGDPSCAPCAIERGAAACRDGRCVIDACDPGYADCNDTPEDGCEADLSRATSCGACDARCEGDEPVCAPALAGGGGGDGNGFACASGCPAEAPERCGDECASTMTSVAHCGRCGAACPAVDHATAECRGGTCGFVCRDGFRACGGGCVVLTDPTACGPGCVVCPTPANATATCKADECGIACKAGFADCNQDPADGCEVALATDARHCGACGASCDGGRCNGGVCSAPSDGG